MENKIYGYVYLLTNKINGMQYVGQTVRTLKIRFSKHITDSKHGKTYINRAIKKYGIENFTIKQVDIAYNQEELNLIEGVYMAWFNTLAPNGYNLKETIDGRGRHSEESKEKMRKIANQPERLKLSSELGKKCRGKARKNSNSKYCGVHIQKNKYKSKISFNNKQIHIGYYNTETDAARAYDIRAIELYGSDAILNFPELRQDYIENKIIIKANNQESKSRIKNIIFDTTHNRWKFRWIDKITHNNKSKSFKYLDEAIKFKLQIDDI